MKKYIIGLIFGIVLTLGGVVIAENLNASNIDYNDTTVEGALNDLYTEANKDILTKLNLSSDKITFSESYGNRIPNRSTTLNVAEGSYMIVASYHGSGGTTGTSVVANNTNSIVLSSTAGTCIRLSGRKINSFITPFATANSGLHLVSSETVAVFTCKFNSSDTLTVSSNESVPESDYHESHIMVQAIKLD